jgi:hypothetical protein
MNVRQRLQNLEKAWDEQHGTDYVREALRRNWETGELPSHEPRKFCRSPSGDRRAAAVV